MNLSRPPDKSLPEISMESTNKDATKLRPRDRHKLASICCVCVCIYLYFLLIAPTVWAQAAEFIYTIRTGDGLVLAYGTEEGLKAVKALILRKAAGKPRAQEVASWIKAVHLPGVRSVEYFVETPPEAAPFVLHRLTVRDAILQGILPLVEGLTGEQAARLLTKLGWTVLKESDLQSIQANDRRPKRLVVLAGTGPNDEITVGVSR